MKILIVELGTRNMRRFVFREIRFERLRMLWVLCLLSCGLTVLAEDNIALNRPYTLKPSPNYKNSEDATDPFPNSDPKRIRLTDGELAPGRDSMWAHEETVGWRDNDPLITIDLGKREPISGVSFHTAACNDAEVFWPKAIIVMVSDDGKSWTFAGDLVELSAKSDPPPSTTNAAVPHYFASNDLEVSGRFVALHVICSAPYIFCDEIEVYRGPFTLLSKKMKGETVQSLEETQVFGSRSAIRLGTVRRVTADIGAVRESLQKSGLQNSERKSVAANLNECEKSIASLPGPEDARNFKAILPLNELHEKVLSSLATILRAQGLPRLVVGKQHHFDPLRWLSSPPKGDKVALFFEMMGNEFRADDFVLTNTTDRGETAILRVRGLPNAPCPPWLRISSVAWTDTQEGVPVAQALSDTLCDGGGFKIMLPSGVSRMVWLTVDSSKLPAGDYRGSIEIEAMGLRSSVPFNVRVSPVSMGRPRLSLGMWDYSDAQSRLYGISPANVKAAVSLMESHFVDSPWASAAVLLRPSKSLNPSEGALEFATLDEWISRWPNARRYIIFAGVNNFFDGAPMGSPEFQEGVSNWAKRLVQHMRDLTLKPEQLTLMLVDEPHTEPQFETAAAWAKVIKSAAPELKIFEIPNWTTERSQNQEDMISLTDIACMGPIGDESDAMFKYYEARMEQGQHLWFYQCSGPSRQYDPDYYYRRLAWRAFRYGASGIGVWSFGDTGGAPTSWNEYVQPRANYAPEFLGITDATDSVQMQAIREGVEDYEYLAMLKDAAKESKDDEFRVKAESLLAEAGKTVGTGVGIPDRDKGIPVDHTAADSFRLRVLKLLEASTR